MCTDRWMVKDVVHIYNGILLSHWKGWNNAICSNMDGPGDCHTEWRKVDRERQISYDITYVWNLKKMTQMNLFINRNRLTDLEKKFMATKGERRGQE